MTDQRYVIDASVQSGYVGNRDVATFLPFLVPDLRPGVDVLDAGCGVGAITLDVAARVAPGRVLGVDADAGQIALARAAATERGLKNVRFEVGSVYALPAADAEFDVAYANAVLFYVREPLRALAEMRRVLRPDGLAAVCEDDLESAVFSPGLPELSRSVYLFERLVAREGGDPHRSRHMRRMMREAGFARTSGIAHTPEVYGDEASTSFFADFATGILGAPETRALMVAEGWIDEAELDELLATVRSWADGPDAFATWLYCGAIGRLR
jgi:SAM-dependent methyltransferase